MPPPIDLAVFDETRHSPPFLGLQRALPGRPLRDYCVPVNPYFPTAAMFRVFRDRLEEVLKYYPASNAELGRVLGEALAWTRKRSSWPTVPRSCSPGSTSSWCTPP